MEKIITYETLRNFAYSNDRICKKPLRGIVLEFRGLGFKEMFWEDYAIPIRMAENGIIYILPYYNPWCWMNDQAVAYVDELIDVVMEHYGLPNDIPIVATGGSMGGLSALVYTAYASRVPSACIANCPVCDLPYHFTERPDLPRTLYSAFWHYSGTLEDAMRKTSPLHIADSMPDTNYYVFHCEEDKDVNKQKHSDLFVDAMKKNHKISYYPIPERGHCDLPPEVKEFYWTLVEQNIMKQHNNS